MPILRFLLLGFTVMFTFAVGSGTNTAAAISAVVFIPSVIALYLLPTIEANLNEHNDLTAIFMLNLFLGWTIFGWVISMVWAHKRTTQMVEVATSNAGPSLDSGDTKTCPYCAETVKKAAIRCRHCGSSLES